MFHSSPACRGRLGGGKVLIDGCITAFHPSLTPPQPSPASGGEQVVRDSNPRIPTTFLEGWQSG